MILFFMLPYWHVFGKPNPSSETYRVKPELFAKAAQDMVDKYTVRTEGEGKVPVVAPPAGSDI